MSDTPNRFDPYTGDPIPEDSRSIRPGESGENVSGSHQAGTDGYPGGAESSTHEGSYSGSYTGYTGAGFGDSSSQDSQSSQSSSGSYYSQNGTDRQDSQNSYGTYYSQNGTDQQSSYNSQNTQYSSGSYYDQNNRAGQNTRNSSGTYNSQSGTGSSQNTDNTQNTGYNSGNYNSTNTSKNYGAGQNAGYNSGSFYSQYSGAGQNRPSGTPHPGYREGRNSGLTPQETDRRARTYGIISLVCGICTIVFSFASMCCCPFISVLTGIAAIIFGIMARDSTGTRLGYGTAGFVTGIIGLVLTVLISIIMVTYVGSDNFKNSFEGQLKKYYNSEENDTSPFGGNGGSFTIPGQDGNSFRFTIPGGNDNSFGD